jgi:septum formation inhibitor MinC
MLNGGLLQVTGRGTNVNFTIDDRAPFAAVIAGMEECLVNNRHLFSKGNITVNVGRRILAREQLTQIKRILEAESGLTVAQFWCSPEILEETLSDAGPEQPPEVLDKDTSIKSQGPAEYLPDPAIPLARLGLEESENSADAADSPEAEAYDYSQAQAEPGAQVSPESPESVSDLIHEPSPQIVEEPTKEPTIEPIVEPGLLELALKGLDQSIAAGSAFKESLDLGQGGSTASLESRLAVNSPEEDSPEAKLEEASLGTGAAVNTSTGTSISRHQESGGLDRQNEALLIKTTCRSGEVVRYPGDVVILADVNPGAEIIADGDILVWGSLRGMAHAGAGGDIQATIIALNLESPRIQIGPYIGMAPKAKKHSKSNRPGPTLAFVRRQQILVAPFKGRFAGYSGGTIYDG